MTLPRRVGATFISVLIGWAAGLLFYIIAGIATNVPGWRSDAGAVALWSAVLVLIAWVLVVVPLTFFIPSSSRVLDLPWSCLLGATCGVLIFGLLFSMLGGRDLFQATTYVTHAAIVGATVGWLYGRIAQAWGG